MIRLTPNLISNDLDKTFTLSCHNDTIITANEDLNNYITSGNFMVKYASTAATISNIPEQVGGILKVLTGSSSGNVLQYYITNNNYIYIRFKNNNGWSTWRTIASRDDIDDSISGNTVTLKGHNDIIITANSNLNDYVTPGNFVVTTTSSASTISNIPVQTGGILKVLTGSSSGNVLQYYIANNSYVYHRKKDNSGWSNWIYPEDKITAIIQSGDDLNDYIIPGQYQIQGSSDARTILNSPTGYPGTIKVIYGSFDRYLIQIYYTDNHSEMFVRSMIQGSGAWNEWNDLSSPNIALKSLSKVLTALINDAEYNISFANALVPLKIKNYMGNYFNVHPKVLYFDNGFNGHNYWMAYTPYPFSDDNAENPCICYSDDGINWIEIDGNPIDDPNGYGYNSDTHLVYIPETGTLECWFRYVGDSSLEVREETIYRKKSIDGVNWSEKELMQTNITGNYAKYLSPAIEWDGTKYLIWVVGNGIEYYESANGKNWTFVRSLSNISFNDDGVSVRPWHIDVIRTNNKFVILAMCRTSTDVNTPVNLFITTSDDNVSYGIPYKVIEGSNGWDQYMYRSSIVKCGSEYRIYYSAGAPNGNTFYSNTKWGIGVSKSSSLENFKGIY